MSTPSTPVQELLQNFPFLLCSMSFFRRSSLLSSPASFEVSIKISNIVPFAAVECNNAAPTNHRLNHLTCELFEMVPELFSSDERPFAAAMEFAGCRALVRFGFVEMALQLPFIPPARLFACDAATIMWYVLMHVVQVINKFFRAIELYLA